jgi:hypothetical protein
MWVIGEEVLLLLDETFQMDELLAEFNVSTIIL